ncbi:deoxyribonuclease IV [Cohnella lubricantis]|uniref:Deoxyribonuclease IV n=1 Tax=Cohnella lubricantis TaxID=2163172 RepID=A0A841T866_9BACL|nr:deoxyribonuclease IV [Cohnella lubricantis]MBB6676195.1 deoxyribonuclease IV [Cohnella lubricantis]
MIIGSHVSTRRGYREAAKVAERIGGSAYQYFPKNPRSLQLKAFDRQDAARCDEWCRERGMVSIGHGPYLVNPAAEGDLAEQMALSTLNDLAIAEACGSLGVVVHFGVLKDGDPLRGYQNSIQWLNRVLGQWSGKAKILLENQAGDHGDMGTTPEELATVRSLCARPDGVGFCLDTCHLFASGVWNGSHWDEFRERAAKASFWEHLTAVHLNDSRHPAGSRRDRHARIGEGFIGLDGFRELLASPELRHTPLLLETPVDEDGTHKSQIERVKRLAEGE